MVSICSVENLLGRTPFGVPQGVRPLAKPTPFGVPQGVPPLKSQVFYRAVSIHFSVTFIDMTEKEKGRKRGRI